MSSSAVMDGGALLAFRQRGSSDGHGPLRLHRGSCHFITDARVKYAPVTFELFPGDLDSITAYAESCGMELCHYCFPRGRRRG